MLLIFDKNEKLQAILEQDTSISYSKPQGTAHFLSSSYPTPEGKSAPETACPYFDAVHTEKLNQENTFKFSIPANRPEAAFVKEGAYVAFRDADLYWQMFEIQKVTDIHNESGIIRQAYAEHVFYELLNDIIEDVRPYNTTAQAALAAALANTRWQPGIVYDFGLNSVNFYYESVLSAIQKIVNTWGGELRFRIEITDNVITGRYVDILNRRGEDTGKSFEYTKDIVEIQREVDISSVYTAAYGRGKGEEVGITEDGSETYGRRLTFADVVWSKANGDPVDKPAGQEWVGDPEALALWGRNGRHRFGIYMDPDETDPAALLQKTWEFVQKHKNPLITYSLTVLDLERVSGYKHEAVRLGDTVYVRDKDLGIDVAARVIEIERDLLLPENTKIVLGNFRPNIADDAIIQAQINRTVSDRQGVWDRATAFGANGKLSTEWLEGIIDTLQNQINAGAGTVTITEDNGILIVDNAENPTAALRLLGGVFAIANTKNPDGTWNWRTFGTGDGFVADELNSGKIRTALVNIFGDTNFFWDADGIKAINPNDPNQWIKFNKDGLFFTKDNGETYDFSISWSGLYLGKITRDQLAQDIQDELNQAIKSGVSYNNVAISPEVGIKASHATGEYTQLSGEGLKHFVSTPIYTETPTGTPNFEGFEGGVVPTGWEVNAGTVVQNTIKRTGSYAMKLAPDSKNWGFAKKDFYITKDTILTFWYYAGSNTSFKCFIDGVPRSFTATATWTQATIPVTAGWHTIYFENTTATAIYIDDITFEANPVTKTISGWNPAVGYDYAYRVYTGEAETHFNYTSPISTQWGTIDYQNIISLNSKIWINLPHEFRGKNFKVYLYPIETLGVSNSDNLCSIVLRVIDIDIENAAFSVLAYTTRREYGVVNAGGYPVLGWRNELRGLRFGYMVVV